MRCEVKDEILSQYMPYLADSVSQMKKKIPWLNPIAQADYLPQHCKSGLAVEDRRKPSILPFLDYILQLKTPHHLLVNVTTVDFQSYKAA